MAGSRTLKLSILAETKDLVAGLNTASKETQSFGDKATEFGKKAALAFAVAGTAALAFAADAVKAAAQDQLAQEKLAETIKATTNATAAQIAGVEEYITATSIAIGVTDDELRPAFSRLVRSTSDVEQAQRLLNLALDLSAAVGKPVETVANALGKAYDGNTAALAKLGLGLDANLLKSKDNEAIIKSLEKTYGTFAEGAAETAAKKFERIKIATDEAKESIGAALLPVVERLADYVLTTVVPNLESFINGLTGQGSLTEASENATDGAFKFGEQVKKVMKTIISLKDEIIIVASLIATMFVVSKISAAVLGTIALIKSLIKAYNALKASSIVAGVASAFALNPLLGVGAVALAAAVLAGANALAGRSDTDTSDLGVPSAGGFSGTMPNGMPFVTGGGTAGGATAGGGGGGGGFTGSTGGGGGGGGTGAVAVVAKKAEEAITNIAGAFDNFTSGTTTLAGIEAASNRPFAFGTSGVNTNTLAGILAASAQPTINVTVNGAIDREGTARTIVETLNSSAYRGTGGAANLVAL
jgi:hypothetical protein